MRNRILPAAIVLLAFVATSAHAAFTFNTPAEATAAGWTENLSRPAGGLGADFGFSNTPNTTAPSGAGEAGGTIPDRTTDIAYYADITGINFTQSHVFIASGWVRLPTFPGSGGGSVEVGFFNPAGPAAPAGGYAQFAGMTFVDGNRVFLRQGNNSNLITLSGADANNPIKFWLQYQPVAGPFQLLTVNLLRADNSVIGSIASAQVIGNFNFNMTAFGILSGDYNTTSGHLTSIFIDDIMVVPEPGLAGLGILSAMGLPLIRKRKQQERRA